MSSKKITAISHDEIARLAYLNWENDGCPHGHDQKYWLEAEQQIKATGHLLISELNPQADQLPASAKSYPGGRLKKPQRLQQNQSISQS